MEILNLHLYKVIFPDNTKGFEIRDLNIDAVVGASAILKDAVRCIKSEIDGCSKNKSKRVTIDLTPCHDFEIAITGVLKQCLALSPEEKNEFWKIYNSLKD